MRHTSVRLSDHHLELIESTGKSPSKVMREALDLYFKSKPEEGDADRMKALIQEHERTWHKSGHKVSTPEPPPESVPPNVPKESAQRAHDVLTKEAQGSKGVPQSVRTSVAQRAHDVLTKEAQGSKGVPQSVRTSVAQRAQDVPPDVREDPVTLAKRFILAELEAGREPTAAEVAEAVGIESRPLGRLMKAEGLQAKLTGTGNRKVRRYTADMKEKIEELIAKGELEE
jgi:hypothetical protein